jgi:hypothetical protein
MSRSCLSRELLEADGVVLVVVGARDHNGLGLNLGVEPNELACVAFNGARMDRDLRVELVVDDAQFEGAPCADASGVGGDGGSASVPWLAKLGVWSGFG